MTRKLTTFASGGHFFEGPRWHQGRWWASDFYRHAVFSYAEDGTETEELSVPGQPSGLGWLPDGSLLAVSMKDRRLLRRAPDGDVSVYADLSGVATGHLNDLVVDTAGRAFVGNFGFDLMGGAEMRDACVARVDPDGSVTVVADGLRFPNGMVIDGDTLIVAETTGARFTSFRLGADGSLAERSIWAAMGEIPDTTSVMEALGTGLPAPDGCTLDADGHVWFADAVNGRVSRVGPGGFIAESIQLPAGLGAFACALGGDDGRTLLICVAPDFFEENRTAAAEAMLMTTTVDVPHAGLP